MKFKKLLITSIAFILCLTCVFKGTYAATADDITVTLMNTYYSDLESAPDGMTSDSATQLAGTVFTLTTSSSFDDAEYEVSEILIDGIPANTSDYIKGDKVVGTFTKGTSIVINYLKVPTVKVEVLNVYYNDLSSAPVGMTSDSDTKPAGSEFSLSTSSSFDGAEYEVSEILINGKPAKFSDYISGDKVVGTFTEETSIVINYLKVPTVKVEVLNVYYSDLESDPVGMTSDSATQLADSEFKLATSSVYEGEEYYVLEMHKNFSLVNASDYIKGDKVVGIFNEDTDIVINYVKRAKTPGTSYVEFNIQYLDSEDNVENGWTNSGYYLSNEECIFEAESFMFGSAHEAVELTINDVAKDPANYIKDNKFKGTFEERTIINLVMKRVLPDVKIKVTEKFFDKNNTLLEEKVSNLTVEN